MHAAKGAQEVAHRRPQALDGVDVHFPNAVVVVIPRPLLAAMTDRSVAALDMIVARPLIRMTACGRAGEGVDMATQGRPIRRLPYPQPAAARAAAHRPHHRGPIGLISALPLALVGPAPGRIAGIGVPCPFFPPQSETSRRSPSRHPVRPPAPTGHSRWPAPSAVRDAPCSDTPLAPPPDWHCSHLCTRPGAVARLGWPLIGSPQRPSRCRGCPLGRSVCSDHRPTPAGSGEPPAPARPRSCPVDSQTPADENSARSRGCSRSRPTTRQWEISCRQISIRTTFRHEPPKYNLNITVSVLTVQFA